MPFFWRRVYASETGVIYRPYVRVSDPGAPGKMDRLMLRFFWKRVYMCPVILSCLSEIGIQEDHHLYIGDLFAYS